jgi:hypothetical protein
LLSKLLKGVEEAGVDEGVDAPGGSVVVKSMTGAKPFNTVRLALIVVVQSALTACRRGSSSRAAPLETILTKPKRRYRLVE